VFFGVLCVEFIEYLEKCNQPDILPQREVHLEFQDTPWR
jgi:hypothetical protein